MFEGVTLPFNVSGLFVTAIDFVRVYAPWILVVLGFRFLPTIYRTLDKIINGPPPKKRKGGGKKSSGKGSGKKKTTGTKKRSTTATKKKGTSTTSRSRTSSGRKSRYRWEGPLNEMEIRIEKDSNGGFIRREIIYKDGVKMSEIREPFDPRQTG